MPRWPGQALCHRDRSRLPHVDRRPGRGGRRAARASERGASCEERLERLRGEIELPIPAASAVKIGGERAYKLARRGVEVEMPVRRSTVHALDVIAYTGGSVTLDLHVSSGTYVRSIAIALGGHCATLRRTEVGPFSVADAVAPDAFTAERLLLGGRRAGGACDGRTRGPARERRTRACRAAGGAALALPSGRSTASIAAICG